MKNVKKICAVLFFVCYFTEAVFCQQVPLSRSQELHIEGYKEGEQLPSWAKDLRRAEIITLGSLPFTTLNATLIYSLYRYGSHDFDNAYIPNPFPGSSQEAKLNTDEQIGILTAAAAASVVIGLADFIVLKVKQNKLKKQLKQSEREKNDAIEIEIVENAENTENTAAEKESLQETS